MRNKTRRGTELSFYLSDARSKHAEHDLFTRVEPLEYGSPRGGRSCVDDGACQYGSVEHHGGGADRAVGVEVARREERRAALPSTEARSPTF